MKKRRLSEWFKLLERRLLPFNPIPEGGDCWAGVGAILTLGKEILLVKRAVRPGDPWSGDWAMPGGKWKRGDANLYESIKREVMEETSVDISNLRPVGWLPPRSPRIRPELKIMPLVLLTSDRLNIVLNDELTDYRWVYLPSLVCEKRVINTPRSKVFTDVYLINDDNIVWGITARIIQEIIDCIKL